MFYPGEVLTIRWTVEPGFALQHVMLRCWKGDEHRDELTFVGHQHGMLTRRAPAASGRYDWVIPFEFPCSDYLKITVTAVDTQGTGEDQSPTFMILPGPPRVEFLNRCDQPAATPSLPTVTPPFLKPPAE